MMVKIYILSKTFNYFIVMMDRYLGIFYFVFSTDRNPTFEGTNEQFYRRSGLSVSPARKPIV